MQLLYLELRRILKVKRVKILLMIVVVLSIGLAYLPISYENISFTKENGEKIELKGFEALSYKKRVQKNIAGEVTTEKVRMAVEECQNVLREYGANDYYELNDEVYIKRILPVIPLAKGIREISANPITGMAPNILSIKSEDITDYYDKCENWVINLMQIEQKSNLAAQEFAIRKYKHVKKPYVFYPGTSSTAMDYQILLALCVLIICTIVVAPVFSIDYDTKAHDIFKITKHGGILYGSVKIGACFIICILTYLVCMGMYLIVSNSLFGWECTKTSIQMLYSTVNLPNLNVGELQITVALWGLISILATISVTLFLSSISKAPITSLSAGIILCIAPVLIHVIIPGAAEIWMECIMPSSGVCMHMSGLYQLIDFKFLTIGEFAVWTPYSMLIFSIIEIPVFVMGALHSYTRHKLL